jgi:predicted dehydrogenase
LNIGLIGFGNHATKNVISVIDKNQQLKLSSILVRNVPKYPRYENLFTSDESSFFDGEKHEIVYVLSPISTHYSFAKRALDAGINVWCEKPLTSNYLDSLDLVMTAARKKLFLGEIVAYLYHQQYEKIRNLIMENTINGQRLLGSAASFCIPSLEPNNIRLNSSLSGGALLDVGFYPLSIAVDLFGEPRGVFATGHLSPELGVDLSGAALLDYGGSYHFAQWAIGSSYRNEFEISFSHQRHFVERAFSKPPELPTSIVTHVEFSTEQRISMIEPDSQFENLFAHFLSVIKNSDCTESEVIANKSLLRAQVIEQVGKQLRGN